MQSFICFTCLILPVHRYFEHQLVFVEFTYVVGRDAEEYSPLLLARRCLH